MKKLKIALFTAARSDFGIMQNIILRAERDRRFKLDVIVGSAHKTNIFGSTKNEIRNFKIKNRNFFHFEYSGSSEKDILKYFTNTINETQKKILKNKPDCVLITGDRYEMLAVALCCFIYRIPIAHFCGGSETLGSLDDKYRFAISKMASIHFLETKYHRQNLNRNQITKNLYVVGAPALEEIEIRKKNKKKTNKSKEQLIKELNLNLNNLIVTACFHPETTSSIEYNIKNLNIFIKFLKTINANIIFTFPNADAGFEKYIKLIKKKLSNNKNIKLIKNLGIKKYYNLLDISSVLIGNSSSGIIESASFNLPTINLGNRQKNRFSPKNVTHCPFNFSLIKKNYNKVCNSIIKIKNPYYKKNCSKKVLDILFKKLNKIN
jgi:GDP/UDP-N,N'-diacetylbacillosamine 2-epimerase (hydrolysing)